MTGLDTLRGEVGAPRGPGPGAPGIAALLSLLIPGLGQAWLGAVRRGLLIAAPLVCGLAVVGLAALVNPGRLIDALVHPGVIVGLLVVVLGLGIYHVLAIQDAYRSGLRGWHPSRFGSPLLVGALVAAIGLYGTLEVVGLRAYEATSAIFVKPATGFIIPAPSFESTPSSTMPSPTSLIPPEPTPTPIPVPAWAADGRLNLLLIGSDAGPSRWQLRTDTMIVLSVDISTARAAMFGSRATS